MSTVSLNLLRAISIQSIFSYVTSSVLLELELEEDEDVDLFPLLSYFPFFVEIEVNSFPNQPEPVAFEKAAPSAEP